MKNQKLELSTILPFSLTTNRVKLEFLNYLKNEKYKKKYIEDLISTITASLIAKIFHLSI